MGWKQLSDNQAVSWSDLKDAVDKGYIQAGVNTITPSNQCIYKSLANIPSYAQISTTIVNYVNKANNDLLLKKDLRGSNYCYTNSSNYINIPFSVSTTIGQTDFSSGTFAFISNGNVRPIVNLSSLSGSAISVTINLYLLNSNYQVVKKIGYSALANLSNVNSQYFGDLIGVFEGYASFEISISQTISQVTPSTGTLQIGFECPTAIPCSTTTSIQSTYCDNGTASDSYGYWLDLGTTSRLVTITLTITNNHFSGPTLIEILYGGSTIYSTNSGPYTNGTHTISFTYTHDNSNTRAYFRIFELKPC